MELLSERLAGEVSDGKPQANKMSFNIFKQRNARISICLRRKLINYRSEHSDSQSVFSKFYSFEESIMDLQRSLQDFSNSVQVREPSCRTRCSPLTLDLLSISGVALDWWRALIMSASAWTESFACSGT